MRKIIIFSILTIFLAVSVSAGYSEGNSKCNDYFSYYHTKYGTYYSLDFTGGDNPPRWCNEEKKFYSPRFGFYKYNPLYPSWQSHAINPGWKYSSRTRYYPMQSWTYEYYSPLY